MAERRRIVAGLVLAAILPLTACAGPTQQTPDGTGQPTYTLDQPYQPADVALTGTDGEPFSLTADTDADLTLIFFGYTHCPDICQQVMSTIAAAKLRLDETDRERIDVVFVTTDPARDTPAVLRDYLDRFDPTFGGATGELDDIVALGESLKVHIARGRKLPSGGYDVEHSDQVEALAPNDTVTALWTRDVSAAELADDLQTMLDDAENQ